VRNETADRFKRETGWMKKWEEPARQRVVENEADGGPMDSLFGENDTVGKEMPDRREAI